MTTTKQRVAALVLATLMAVAGAVAVSAATADDASAKPSRCGSWEANLYCY